MKTTRTIAWVVLIGMGLALSACDSEKIELQKSPCAGTDGSPCGPKRPVNGPLNHWTPEQA